MRLNISQHRLERAVVVIALLVLGTLPCSGRGAEPAALDFLEKLTDERLCDQSNHVYYLHNKHTFKSIEARVRWRADGGRERTERFILTPDDTEYIGCAIELEIVDARFTNF